MANYQKKDLFNQVGRTFLEMLSVLALIGILSVSSLKAYQFAMDKHQSNIIFNDIKTIIVTFFSPEFETLHDWDNIDVENLNIETQYNADYAIYKEEDNSFFISASYIPKGVCELLVREKPDYLEAIIPNVSTSGICEENNEIDFYIDLALTNGKDQERFENCDENNPCKGCAQCIMNKCIDKDENCSNGKECQKGSCVCGEGKFLNGGANAPGNQYCSYCSSQTQVYATQFECHKCDNQFYVTGMGGCYGCDNNHYAQLPDRKTTIESCDRCPQRYFDITSQLCIKCPAGQWKNEQGTGCE